MDSVETPTPYDPAIKDIQTKFASLHKILNEREGIMLSYVHGLRDEYLKRPSDSLSQIQDLLELREFIKEKTRNNESMVTRIADIDRDLNKLQSELSERTKLNPVAWGSVGYPKLCELLNEIKFDSPMSEIDTSIKIENKDCTASAKEDRYKRMHIAVFKGGKLGDGFASDDLCYPNHLAIDESSQNIYVSDFRQNCVAVFDSKANLINKYSSGIRFPRAITCRNDQLYLIENSHSMQHLSLKTFSLSPKIIPIPSKRVKPPGDLLIVSAFDVSQSGDWYICNRQANKIHCFSKNAYSTFLTSSLVHHPTALRVRDVVYVLESHCNETASVKTISLQGVVLASLPLYSIKEPLYFDLDVADNIIVSDSGQDSIVIFEKSGGLYHRISSSKDQPITRPKGVAVSRTGNLVVVTNNQVGTLLIF